MPPSESRSGTVTHTSLPRNDLPSPGNPTFWTGTSHCDAPQSFAPPINTTALRASSPARRSAEPRTSHGPFPSPEPSASGAPRAPPAFRQQGAIDRENLSVQDKVADLERQVSSVSGLLKQVINDQKENNALVSISDLAAQFKADLTDKFAQFREEMKADNLENRKALREEVEVDIKAVVSQTVTESVGSMSVTVTQLNGAVDAMRKDIRVLKNVVGYVEPESSGIVADVEVSLTHVQQQLGPVANEEVSESMLDALTTISPHPVQPHDVTAAILGPAINSGATPSEIVQDVPTTPTAPDTPSDKPSTSTEEQARYFLDALRGLARLYKSTAFGKRT